MPIPGNLLTTAMAVMPHTDVEQALENALSMDIPFWPQLPNYSYYEVKGDVPPVFQPRPGLPRFASAL